MTLHSMLMYIKPKPLIYLKLLLKHSLMCQNLHHLMLQHGKLLLLLLLLAVLLLLLLHLLQQLLK